MVVLFWEKKFFSFSVQATLVSSYVNLCGPYPYVFNIIKTMLIAPLPSTTVCACVCVSSDCVHFSSERLLKRQAELSESPKLYSLCFWSKLLPCLLRNIIFPSVIYLLSFSVARSWRLPPSWKTLSSLFIFASISTASQAQKRLCYAAPSLLAHLPKDSSKETVHLYLAFLGTVH